MNFHRPIQSSNNRVLAALLLAMICALAGGCEQSPAGMKVVTMRLGKRDFHLEVAVTSDQQETGLMKRDSMPEDHGMIFVFKDVEVRKFWMKDTRFPLDIIFLDQGGKVVSVRRLKAYDRETTSSIFPARYAIELNAGAADAAGLKSGDLLTVPPEADSAKSSGS